MDKETLAPLSGFRDLADEAKGRLEALLRRVFEQFGYQPLETPTLERQEILLNKYGADAQKLLYLFEDNGGRKVGLRYDLTVSLARFVARNFGELNWPYKRYEIGPVWRADRAQKGRWRQFTQADIDIVGTGSIGAETELLEVLSSVAEAIGPSLQRLRCLINDRRLVGELLLKLNLKDQQAALMRTLDKQDKVSDDVFSAELTKIGLSDVQLSQVRGLFLAESDEALDAITELLGQSEALESVKSLLAIGQELGLQMVFAPNMVRGLDYYTGTIFEGRLPGYPSSVLGGGRYDSLVESLIGKKVPAVGFSFGIDRLLDAGVSLPSQGSTHFLLLLPETAESARRWALSLRQQGMRIEVYPDSAVPLGGQIKYADKRGYQTIWIPMPAEWQHGQIVEKNLETGAQRNRPRSEIV